MSDRRKKIVRWCVTVLIVAVLTSVVLLFGIPRFIMFGAVTILGGEEGANQFHHADKPNYENQRIVRSSPDLIYSACSYDVSDGPIRITAPLTGSYMSLSMYTMDTSCFFVRNDKQMPKGFDVVVHAADTPAPDMEGAISVEAPTETGFLLFRNFAGNGKQIPLIEEMRKQARVEVLD